MSEWQPIETAPAMQDIEVMYSVFASDECKRNGGIDIVDEVTTAIRVGNTWCSVLGGKPHAWREIRL
ncbi:MAG: hypothetical protein KA770_00305 [Shewanella sp.]|nr:hypothetical protein [Shewanella sp.]